MRGAAGAGDDHLDAAALRARQEARRGAPACGARRSRARRSRSRARRAPARPPSSPPSRSCCPSGSPRARCRFAIASSFGRGRIVGARAVDRIASGARADVAPRSRGVALPITPADRALRDRAASRPGTRARPRCTTPPTRRSALDAVYLAFDVAPERLGAARSPAARALGGRQLSVSIPHKQAMMRAPRRGRRDGAPDRRREHGDAAGDGALVGSQHRLARRRARARARDAARRQARGRARRRRHGARGRVRAARARRERDGAEPHARARGGARSRARRRSARAPSDALGQLDDVLVNTTQRRPPQRRVARRGRGAARLGRGARRRLRPARDAAAARRARSRRAHRRRASGCSSTRPPSRSGLDGQGRSARCMAEAFDRAAEARRAT